MTQYLPKEDESASSRGQAHLSNKAAWDALARADHPLTRPARADDLVDALKKLDPVGWLGSSIHGKRVLCLAAGGGKHSVQYAAAGADVTVLDLSAAMLDRDREAAARFRQEIRIVKGTMEDLSMFERGAFDIVIQPVSTCYVPDVVAVYREVARVTTVGGLYISQHKQPASLQATLAPSPLGYELVERYYRHGPLSEVAQGGCVREPGTVEYLHRWEELIGGMARSGFVIEDLLEPRHADPKAAVGSFGHCCVYVAPYVRVKARRVDRRVDGPVDAAPGSAEIWTP